MAMTSCGSSKKATTTQSYTQPTTEKVKTQGDSEKGRAIEKEAKKWLGTKYKFGGTTRKGVDCSGLVMEVYRVVFGVKLPRNSAEQSRFCKEIKKKDLKKRKTAVYPTLLSILFLKAQKRERVLKSLREWTKSVLT